jgi:nicotinamide riboside kinase
MQWESNRIPHFIIISGSVGTGKTTLARILATSIQTKQLQIEKTVQTTKYEIEEINAANRNGIDEIRQLSEKMKYKPMYPSTAKVVIMDEAHQLTTAAQNALITETEDTLDHVFYIFCTSAINKIIPALKRRAFIINPTSLNEMDIKLLLDKSLQFIGKQLDTTELIESLLMFEISSPGIILQCLERFISGDSAKDSVTLISTDSSKVDSMLLCRSISKGDWDESRKQLVNVTKNDVFMLKCCVLGYLKTILVKCNGPKAILLAKAVNHITNSSNDDQFCLSSFFSNVCLACAEINKIQK